MTPSTHGHIEQLPSGSFRVSVYAGKDPLTGRDIRHRQTARTMEQAQIMLGKLIAQAGAGRQPDSRVRMAELLDRYLEVAELEPSTRDTYEGYIRRTLMPALGPVELRKVRGPMLDTLYARLRRCGDLACNGRPFVEHNHFPALGRVGGGRYQRWQQIAGLIREAVALGDLAPGERLCSTQALATIYEVPLAAVRHAIKVLAQEGTLEVRRGRPAIVAGRRQDADALQAAQGATRRSRRARARHDCAQAGCAPHRCRPMSPRTIRQLHAILSGAFAAAVRWEWIDRNPASSARVPRARPRLPSSPEPADVARVIATARDQGLDLLALCLWLAAVTGARRGELCALQWDDLDLDRGVMHVARSYLVRAGMKQHKDTKTHQDRLLALDKITVAVLADRLQLARDALAPVGVKHPPASFVFSGDLLGAEPWNPDWVTHKVSEIAQAAGVRLNIKALRHYSASQLLAGGIDLRNTAARLGHGDGGATTLRHYADPVSEVDRRAATYLAELTSQPAASLRR